VHARAASSVAITAPMRLPPVIRTALSLSSMDMFSDYSSHEYASERSALDREAPDCRLSSRAEAFDDG
jgi:hypothetical protein